MIEWPEKAAASCKRDTGPGGQDTQATDSGGNTLIHGYMSRGLRYTGIDNHRFEIGKISLIIW